MMSKTVLVPTIETARDAEFADRLVKKYRAAVNGLMSQIEFGAMLMLKREELADPSGATNRPGGGLKNWLQQNAPEIHVGTAHRFMRCAEAAAAVAKLRSDEAALLLGGAIDKLTAEEQRKRTRLQLALGEYASQRQLLLALGSGDDEPKAAKPAEGNKRFQDWLKLTHNEGTAKKLGDLPKSLQQEFRTWERKEIEKRAGEIEATAPKEDARKFWTRWVAEGYREGFGKKHSWAALNDVERDALVELCDQLAKTIRATAKK